MIGRLKVLALGFVGWILFFQAARAFFMLYQFDATAQLTLTDIFQAFAHGIRMDMAMAGYFSLLPGLILAILFFASGKVIWKIWFPYQIILIAISTFIVVLDAELYVHWGFRLDATPILYFGKEAASSGDLWKSIVLILGWLIFTAGISFLTYRFFKSRIEQLKSVRWVAFPALLAATVFLILPIRGSL